MGEMIIDMKRNNNKNTIENIKNLVKKACRKDTNAYGHGSWSHHILTVVKYSKMLAKKLNADIEIVEIAALLHDYASVVNKEWMPEHHIHSARLAEEILRKHRYPENKIKKVKHCIISHRASKQIPRESIEAKIVASADALAHFDKVNSLLYFVFIHQKMNIDEGTKWVLAKLERSWKKLIPEAKEMVREKYKAIKIALT
jgi:uncharacterized protein